MLGGSEFRLSLHFWTSSISVPELSVARWKQRAGLYSLSDLSRFVPVPGDHMLIVLKSYFDGGNEADSTQYDHLTLAAMAGGKEHWKSFNTAWKKVLRKHGADWLHTTDAVSLLGIYTRWTDASVEKFINDCVTVIKDHATPSGHGKGVRPVTVTVVLKDFLRAFKKNPGIGTPEENCAIHCFNAVIWHGQKAGYSKFECYFDQGEKFCGFIQDRVSNKRSRQNDPILKDIVHVGQSDMRLVPALQAADLFAWAVNDSYRVRTLRPWQQILLGEDIPRQWDLLDYGALTTGLKHEEIERVRSWNLPKRRQPR